LNEENLNLCRLLHYWGKEIKDYEVYGGRNMHEESREMRTKFYSDKLNVREHVDDQELDMRTTQMVHIIRWTLKSCDSE
jgi:hypothetical protein